MSEAFANRVFISCVSDEFEKPQARFLGFRRQLRHYLTRADCEVKVQEDFRQTGDRDTVEKLDGYIRKCAAVIHLVGELPGAVADKKAVADYVAAVPEFLENHPDVRAALGDFSDLTYTQWEAFIALHHGVPLFVYATDKASAQQKHLDRLLIGRKHAAPIENAGDLLGQLIGDIHAIIASIPGGPALANVPRLPGHYQDRPEDLNALRARVLTAGGAKVGVAGAPPPVGLHGMGGIGKTTLAAALARDPAVKEAFPGGIIWVNLGQIDPRTRREDLTTRQADVAFALSGKEAFFRDVEAGKTRLSALLAGKRVLLILDDAWDPADVLAFDVMPESGCLVVTSRNSYLLRGFGAAVHVVGVLGQEAGLELLARASGVPGDRLPAEARDVLRECGYLPLAIALCAGQARAGVPWAHILEALREADLEFLDASNGSVMRALKSSVDALPDPRLCAAYLRLAVYPADVAVPVASVVTLWCHALGIREREARRILATLAERSLLAVDPGAEQVSLHDLQHDYLRLVRGEKIRPDHEDLLAAYRDKCSGGGWHTGPNDGYFHSFLAHHLVMACRADELEDLLLDYRWLRARLLATNMSALRGDFTLAAGGKRPALELIAAALDLSSHVLARHPEQLAAQLLGRLMAEHDSDVSQLLQQCADGSGSPALTPKFPSLLGPRSPLCRTMDRHRGKVKHLALGSQPGTVVSSCDRGDVCVWDYRTGAVLHAWRPKGRDAPRLAVAAGAGLVVCSRGSFTKQPIFPEVWDLVAGTLLHRIEEVYAWDPVVAVGSAGRKALATSEEGLIAWDLQEARLLGRLQGHTSTVNVLWISPDAQWAVSGDDTLIIWDVESGQALHYLRGHNDTVDQLLVSPDGRTIASAASWISDKDHSMKLWDRSTGLLRHNFQFEKPPRTMAFSLNGNRIAVSFERQIYIWDVEYGDKVRTIDDSYITSLAFTLDGQFLIATAYSGEMRVWDTNSGERKGLLRGHGKSVETVLVSPEGHIISGSEDCTARVWSLARSAVLSSHGAHLQDAEGIAVSPDGRTGFSISKNDHWLTAWDVKSGAVRWKAEGHDAAMPIMQVSPSGEHVVTTSSVVSVKALKVRETAAGTLLKEIEAELTRLLLSRDGRRLAGLTRGGEIKVWSFPDCQLLRTSDLKPEVLPGDGAAPDGSESSGRKCFASVQTADLDTPSELLLVGLDVYLPDSSTGQGHSTAAAVLIRNLDTGASRLLARHPGSVGLTAISRQGRHAAAVFDWMRGAALGSLTIDEIPDYWRRWQGTPNIYLWDVGDARLVRTLLHPVPHVLAFAPDGQHLFSASWGGEIKMWRVSDGEEVRTLSGHSNCVAALAFTEDGEHVVSISHDCTLAVWRVDSGKRVATFTADAPLEHLALSNGSDTVVIAQSDGRVHVLRLSGVH